MNNENPENPNSLNPPALRRSLSLQHWEDAKTVLMEGELDSIKAGHLISWVGRKYVYTLERESKSSQNLVKRCRTYQDGVLVEDSTSPY